MKKKKILCIFIILIPLFNSFQPSIRHKKTVINVLSQKIDNINNNLYNDFSKSVYLRNSQKKFKPKVNMSTERNKKKLNKTNSSQDEFNDFAYSWYVLTEIIFAATTLFGVYWMGKRVENESSEIIKFVKTIFGGTFIGAVTTFVCGGELSLFFGFLQIKEDIEGTNNNPLINNII